MSQIRIYLFGRFCVQRDEQVVAGFGAHKLQELLGYLMLHRQRPVSREALASLLWPDTTTAQSKKNLRQALWHLQSALSWQDVPGCDRILLVEPDQIRVNTETDFWLDVAIFEKAFESIQRRADHELDMQQAQVLHNAVQLYRGPLQEGCYEDWCLYERERLQNLYLAMIDTLMSYYEVHQDYNVGIEYGMRILSYTRVHERTYRRLMRLHYLNGDRATALSLYKQCAKVLDEELGVNPSKRTIELYKQILAEQLVEPGSIPLTPTEIQPARELLPSPLIDALSYLVQLQESLTHLQSQVQQSIHQVKRALNESYDASGPDKMESDKRKDDTETY